MKHFLIIISLLCVNQLFAQDPNYSQFYNNPIYYNPAMTSINNGMTFRLNARNLWGPIPGRFNTFSGSAEAQTVYKMGLGLTAYSDVAGEAMLRTTGGYLTYSYRPVDMKNFIIQAGVSGGFINKNIDWSRLTFSDQLDETQGSIYTSAFIPPSYKSVSYADFSAGIVARFNGSAQRNRGAFKRFSSTIGGSVQHLSEPKDAFLGDNEHLPMKMVIHNSNYLLFNDIIVSPGFTYEQQSEFQTFTMGVNVVNKPFTFGLWVRNRTAAFRAKQYDSYIVTMGLNLPSRQSMQWRVMYSFDFTVSRLKTSSYGSHELSLVFDFGNKVLFRGRASERNIRRRYECPKDFFGYQY